MRRRSNALIPLEVSILEAAVGLHRRGTTAFHGYAVAKLVKTQADRRLLTAYGTLYRALHRLERAGLIESFWEDPSAAEHESRPRRRLYRLTALAEVALARARAERRAAGRLRSLKEGFGTRGAR
jgi:DNA-binding PadR family transcriptional regulator